MVKSWPPGLEALLEIYGSSVKRRPSWSLNSTTTSLPILSALFERDPQTLLESMLSGTLRQKSELLHSSHWFDLALSETQRFKTLRYCKESVQNSADQDPKETPSPLL